MLWFEYDCHTKSKTAICSTSQLGKAVDSSQATRKRASHQAPPEFSVRPRRTVGETTCRPVSAAASWMYQKAST